MVGHVPTEHSENEKADRSGDREYSPEFLRELARTYHRSLIREHKPYFHSRGLSIETEDTYLLGYTGDAYVIPIWDGESITTIKFRRDDEKHPKGPKYWGLKDDKGARLFAPKELRGKVIWCEGELDALLLTQLGYVAVSLTNGIGADPSPFAERFGLLERITIATDNDIPSYRRSLQLVQWFSENTHSEIRIIRYPWKVKDPTDLLVKGGAEAVRDVFGCP